MLTESFKCFTSAGLVLIFALIDELHFSLSHLVVVFMYLQYVIVQYRNNRASYIPSPTIY